MIRKINIFLSQHSYLVAVSVDHLLKFWAVTLFLLAGAVCVNGIFNIIFWGNPLLGVFQLLSCWYWYKYTMSKASQSEMYNNLHNHQETIGGLVDVIQKVAAPNASIFNMPPKKKKLVN